MKTGLISAAKLRYSITAMCADLGSEVSKTCHFPGAPADGKKPACSVFVGRDGWELFKDHRAGESYDGPALLARILGISKGDGCRKFIEMSGLVKPLDAKNTGKSTGAKRRKPAPAPKAVPEAKAKPPVAPPFDYRLLSPCELDADEVEAVATTRSVSVRAVEWLMHWGVFHTVTLSPDLKLPIPREARPFKAWALHSPDWQSFRIRAFAGLLPGFDGHYHKSLTPSGASCSSPVWIGCEDAGRVVVLEGEADAIGAAEIIRRERSFEGLAVVVMFSSSISIPSSFLHRFSGRRVRIVPHVGDTKRQGEIAAAKWAAALKPFADDIQIFTLAGLLMGDGQAVGDVGDLAQCTDEVLKSLGGVTTW